MTSTDSRLDLIELTSRYAFAVDTFNLGAVMDVWVKDDPVFDERPLGLGRAQGTAAVRRYFSEDVFGKVDAIVHITTNHVFSAITDSSARGACTALVVGDAKGGGSFQATVYYEDVFEVVDGGWRFRSRTVNPLAKPRLGAVKG